MAFEIQDTNGFNYRSGNGLGPFGMGTVGSPNNATSSGNGITGTGSFWGSAKSTAGASPSWWDQNKQTVTSGLAGFGAGYSAIAARNQAQGQKNVLGFEAQQAGYNAAIAGYQADIAQQVGAAKEQDSRLQTAAQFGSERAHMAAGGIDLGQGSATDVLASTEYMGERNAAMIRDDTNRQVWQYHNQQTMYQADQQAKLAQQSAINPDMAAFGSLLGSASSFAMRQ